MANFMVQEMKVWWSLIFAQWMKELEVPSAADVLSVIGPLGTHGINDDGEPFFVGDMQFL